MQTRKLLVIFCKHPSGKYTYTPPMRLDSEKAAAMCDELAEANEGCKYTALDVWQLDFELASYMSRQEAYAEAQRVFNEDTYQ